MSSLEYPEASHIVHNDIYVDDCISGQNNQEDLRILTDDLEVVLNKGGFQLKGITVSGHKPPSNLSSDEVSVGVGGMKWYPEGDFLMLNIKDELNFSRKIRGKKSVVHVGEIPDNLTRRDCVGKVAEIFDPLGKVTPITCGFKLDVNELSRRKLDWGDTIPDDLRKVWDDNFQLIKEIGTVKFNRAIVPAGAISLDIETLDTADASESLVCVAIYARFELPQSMHSCQLIFSRSKIIPQYTTMPRAELIAATLNATTGHVVKMSLGKYHKSCLKLCDSQVVLHWIHSTKAELKLLVRNRVIEINRLTNKDDWRYIASQENSADLGTRRITNISKVATDSVWVNGKPWMSGNLCDFSVKTVHELSLSSEDKIEIVREGTPLCNVGPNYLSRVLVSNYAVDWSGSERIKQVYEFSKYIIDPNRFGFGKIIRILAYVFRFVMNFCKKFSKNKSNNDCTYFGPHRDENHVSHSTTVKIYSVNNDNTEKGNNII